MIDTEYTYEPELRDPAPHGNSILDDDNTAIAELVMCVLPDAQYHDMLNDMDSFAGTAVLGLEEHKHSCMRGVIRNTTLESLRVSLSTVRERIHARMPVARYHVWINRRGEPDKPRMYPAGTAVLITIIELLDAA